MSRTALVALTIGVIALSAPFAAFARGCGEETRAASCMEGTSWSDASQKCIPIVGS